MTLSAEELLAGAGITHEVTIPEELLGSNGSGPSEGKVATTTACLRPS